MKTKIQMSLGFQVEIQMSLEMMKYRGIYPKKLPILARLIPKTDPGQMALMASIRLSMAKVILLKNRKPPIKKADGFRSIKQMLFQHLLAAVPNMTTTINGN